MAFLIATFLLFFYCYPSGNLKNIIFILTIIVIGLSISGNITILVTILLLYLTLSIKRIKFFNNISLKKIIKIKGSLIILLCILILSANYIKDFVNDMNILNKIFKGIIDSTHILNTTYTDERFISMKATLELIPKYLLGIGYNMSHSILELTNDNLNANSSFNFILTNQIELGIVGSFIYCTFIKKLSIDLIINRYNNYNIALGISVIGCFMTQIGNGIRFTPFMWLIFGLASIEQFNIREKNKYLYNKEEGVQV